MENIKQILDYGFPTFFGVATVMFIWTLIKQLPKLIQVWTDFNMAIVDNSKATRSLTEVTKANDKSILEEFKKIKKRLECHDLNMEDLKANQSEILTILNEIRRELTNE